MPILHFFALDVTIGCWFSASDKSLRLRDDVTVKPNLDRDIVKLAKTWEIFDNDKVMQRTAGVLENFTEVGTSNEIYPLLYMNV